jgi:hypothetical protein
MKKALWFLSALALTGLVAVACDDGTEPCNGLCDDTEACVRVQNDASHCFDAAFIAQRSDCLNADGSWVDGWALYLDDDEGLYLCRSNDDDYGDTCTSSDDCPTGQICNDDHVCEVDTAEHYRYVKIDDLSTKSSGDDPGADIDAVYHVKNGVAKSAVRQVGYKRSDGLTGKDASRKYLAADPEQAVGDADGIWTYPNPNGKCKYYKDNSTNISNATCKTNKDDPSCDWDYTFVSLGGQGGYIILEMDRDIEENDTIDVLEIGGNCKLVNTIDNGTGEGPGASGTEQMRVFVSVSKAAEGSHWKAIGEGQGANGTGVATFTVSGGALN